MHSSPEKTLLKNYSADVKIWMDCGEHGKVPLAHASSTFVIAATPSSVPACSAKIILVVDGERIERPVRLPNGMSADAKEAAISSQDAVAPF
jgi:hypothetical protein